MPRKHSGGGLGFYARRRKLQRKRKLQRQKRDETEHLADVSSENIQQKEEEKPNTDVVSSDLSPPRPIASTVNTKSPLSLESPHKVFQKVVSECFPASSAPTTAPVPWTVTNPPILASALAVSAQEAVSAPEAVPEKVEVAKSPETSHFVAAGYSSPGACKYQEDRVVVECPFNAEKQHNFVAVYDGHGGVQASEYCTKKLHLFLLQEDGYTNGKIGEALTNAFVKTEKMYEAGCTALCALATPDTLYVANAGDCRCILGTRSGDVVALSTDHKPDNPIEKKRIEASGSCVTTQFAVLNGVRIKVSRIDGRIAVARSIGDPDFKEIPGSPNNAMSCYPDIVEHKITPDDMFICLGSDGLYDVMTNEEIAAFIKVRLASKPHPTLAEVQQISQELVTHAVKVKLSTDNTTAVIAVL